MAKLYCLSPEGVPENQVLFPTIRPYFISQGHCFVDRIEDCGVVLIDLHSRMFDYRQDDIEWVCNNNTPCSIWDEWDRGNLSNDPWPYPLTEQQEKIFFHISAKGIKNVQFCRLLDKTNLPLTTVYPFEKSIFYEEPFLTAEQLFERPFDVCMICNTSPNRETIAKALREDGRLKCITCIAKPKIPFNEWVNQHKTAKLFVSASGGGFSNERIQSLFSVAGLIQENTNQLLLHPFSHLINCIKISPEPTKEELDTIYEIVNNKEHLFEIYQNQYTFVKKYYSQEYLANYYLSTMQKHGII